MGEEKRGEKRRSWGNEEGERGGFNNEGKG